MNDETKYRPLKNGEIIQVGDQICANGNCRDVEFSLWMECSGENELFFLSTPRDVSRTHDKGRKPC